MMNCTRRGPSPILMTETACRHDRKRAIELYAMAVKGKGRHKDCKLLTWDQYVTGGMSRGVSPTLIECIDCPEGKERMK